MPPRSGYVQRGVSLALLSFPYFSISYLARVTFGVDQDGAMLFLFAYMAIVGVENIMLMRISRVSPPTWYLVTILTLDFLFGVWGSSVTPRLGLTLLAVSCIILRVASLMMGVRAIIERRWVIPFALASKDPELTRIGARRKRFYEDADQKLVEMGWIRD